LLAAAGIAHAEPAAVGAAGVAQAPASTPPSTPAFVERPRTVYRAQRGWRALLLATGLALALPAAAVAGALYLLH
ncbi:MAG TPA: hypothetical protein VED41_13570, partial [Solirubrobacteraceae bacterium]|nr:hypothetical protein [Solirubrobacteraceae bacterium]